MDGLETLIAYSREGLEVTAVEGGTAALPCDFQHPKDDSVFLILWFKDNLTTPIYNYDLRPGAVRKRWEDETVLGSRSVLDVSQSPAHLNLKDVKASDAGRYRCRVDFRTQPTKTTRVELRVIGERHCLMCYISNECIDKTIGHPVFRQPEEY
ncbi:hypothetical protein Pmani_034253 [Petrolisthes manimaculis]|uniref:Ig-like domain-containing protein n=1 Tax=Petrolisthes manimaculis TaxID=1843537 RepID=A0AAE1NPR3_9EUCA|nr:hypothetical protein Pmani_034253 [Petrolisthes manimaculis]